MIDSSAEANRTLSVWNVQPVVPFNLNRDFHLISRITTPVIQRPLTGNTTSLALETSISVWIRPYDGDTLSNTCAAEQSTLECCPSAGLLYIRSACSRHFGFQHLLVCQRRGSQDQLHAHPALQCFISGILECHATKRGRVTGFSNLSPSACRFRLCSQPTGSNLPSI